MPCDVQKTRVHSGRTELCIVVQKHIRLKVGCIFLVSKARYCLKGSRDTFRDSRRAAHKDRQCLGEADGTFGAELGREKCALKF
jgi:hypothetical protein